MTNVKVGLFDLYVIKPLWAIYTVMFVTYFINGAWVIGGFLVVMWFLISLIGQGLHPNKTCRELLRGTTPTEEEIDGDPNPNEISYEESLIIARATFKLAGLIGITATTLSLFHGARWYYAVLIGGGLWYLSTLIISMYSACLIALRLRKMQ